ncbi:bifunctional DNA-formamidopyrimidine glycosylase/DNA-(apurinic or apyrimidinic site) lyase [Spongiibacter sp. KMU-158]|uniref:Formamidopyrimidine-DNA glycosylase n=1 Tax=Spongiibacter pelagi TaxID=2760804 RepID=A0A927BZS2_9GAMM|nr:bifunctional DNA-formamidopyrimidine glycosylase/DNA-(apurinic or apyrimidinic site) lyase [Spongiibacter pelagi]MBD2857407.1 bifunctional DNA-formamidopyrimidine glycosylase/DNA-(apurinic or apyrimidinic site) lyase [Spongiibacter pelagi]
MPELPEVETVRAGIAPHLTEQRFSKTIVRNPNLRWPVPANLEKLLRNQRVLNVERRAKYLLIKLETGTLVIHLGMSGRLYFVSPDTPLGKHDHLDWLLDNGKLMRYTDPRRFGAVLWLNPGEETSHKLFSALGPEPLSDAFSAEYLYSKTRNRKQPLKSFIMDGHIVVGVGNIYANEALFLSGIRPTLEAGKLSKPRCERLVENIKIVLAKAIAQGGTTLKDFVNGDGKPGYFKQELMVYGRGGEACVNCKTTLKEIRLAQRSTVYCPRCQK